MTTFEKEWYFLGSWSKSKNWLESNNQNTINQVTLVQISEPHSRIKCSPNPKHKLRYQK